MGCLFRAGTTSPDLGLFERLSELTSIRTISPAYFTDADYRWLRVVCEPQAIAVGDAFIFPDFELRHRSTRECWLLEIVGYWTADYVRKKLSMMKAARIERLILCIDEERCCTEAQLDFDACVFRDRRRVDPRAVLKIVNPGVLKEVPPLQQKRKASRRR